MFASRCISLQRNRFALAPRLFAAPSLRAQHMSSAAQAGPVELSIREKVCITLREHVSVSS